jgi:predicted transcriptional regulator
MAKKYVPVISAQLSAQVTAAWLNTCKGRITADEVFMFLDKCHAHFLHLSRVAEADLRNLPPLPPHPPAVSVDESLASPEHIISLIDGKPYKFLKRHLRAYGLTPELYRERYGLRSDYPMVAPAYKQKRQAIASESRLGKDTGRGRSKRRIQRPPQP